MNFLGLLFLAVFSVAVSKEPCDTMNSLDDPTRAVNETLGDSERGKCDRDLSPGWYKVKYDGDIATSCPPLTSCKTLLPVWINGTLPVQNGSHGRVDACLRGFIGCCDAKISIEVKNCGGYNVFKLAALPSCPGRYCIEGHKIRASCQTGFSSEDGFEPCKRINISFTSVPTVHPYIPTFVHNSTERNLTFECRIPSASNLQTYIYDVRWVVDKEVIVEKKLLPWKNLKPNGSLYVRDWNRPIDGKLGFKIQCDIRARENSNSTPSAYVSSTEFYAGVKIERTNYEVEGTENVTIRVKSTVPVACSKLGTRLECEFRMELYSLQRQFPSGSQQCNQSTDDADIESSVCGINFDGRRWNNWQSIKVSAKVDKASRLYTASVKLRGIASFDPFWRGYHLPEVKVRVYPKPVPKGHCRSWQDPHFLTFDQRSGTANVTHALGEFILFKHTKKPIAIHTVHRWNGNFEANCAIAVRAGSDIFLIFGCTKPIRWITRWLNCDSQRQLLEVYNRNRGQEFEILLPTGTQVTVNIRSNSYLDIYVHASAADYGLTRGLCGTYNGNRSDDWTMRDGTIATRFDTFVQSWSAPEAESLFIMKTRKEILKTAVLYCSCTEDIVSDDGLIEKADCTWRESLPLCYGLNWKQDLCKVGRKRRSESDDNDDDIDASPDVVAYQDPPKESFEWRNGWTEMKARTACEEVLKASALYSVCSSLENIKNEATIESCVDDIKTTGTDLFLKSTSGVLAAQCMYEAQTNTSLWSVSSSESKDLTIKDFIFEQDCPNNCSDIGFCSGGSCHCPSEYTADDCSVKIDSVPEIANVAEDSLCGIKQGRSCDVVSIFGSGFYDSGKIQCLIRSAEMNDREIVPGNSTTTVTGDLLSFSELVCPIATPLSRRKRSVSKPGSTSTYLISITMNGINFSQPFPIVIYDSSCTECQVVNGIFICSGRTDICVNNGACYGIFESRCDGERKQNGAEIEKENYLWLIGAVLGGIAMCLIGVIVVVKVQSRKKTLYFNNSSNEICSPVMKAKQERFSFYYVPEQSEWTEKYGFGGSKLLHVNKLGGQISETGKQN